MARKGKQEQKQSVKNKPTALFLFLPLFLCLQGPSRLIGIEPMSAFGDCLPFAARLQAEIMSPTSRFHKKNQKKAR